MAEGDAASRHLLGGRAHPRPTVRAPGPRVDAHASLDPAGRAVDSLCPAAAAQRSTALRAAQGWLDRLGRRVEDGRRAHLIPHDRLDVVQARRGRLYHLRLVACPQLLEPLEGPLLPEESGGELAVRDQVLDGAAGKGDRDGHV